MVSGALAALARARVLMPAPCDIAARPAADACHLIMGLTISPAEARPPETCTPQVSTLRMIMGRRRLGHLPALHGGAVAQLSGRLARNEASGGSSPASFTGYPCRPSVLSRPPSVPPVFLLARQGFADAVVNHRDEHERSVLFSDRRLGTWEVRPRPPRLPIPCEEFETICFFSRL